MDLVEARSIGSDHERIDGVAKVTGAARYAAEIPAEDMHYVWPVQSTIGRGTVVSVDASAALAQPGVVTVLDATNAPRMQPDAGYAMLFVDPDQAMNVLQSTEITYRGQIVAAVIARSLEAAREAAESVVVEYEKEDHKVVLDADDQNFFLPDTVDGGIPNVTDRGDAAAALAAADVRLDLTYSTPAEHASPMEPHATTGVWNGEDELTLYDSTQGPSTVATIVAHLFDLPPESVHVVADHVGGGFGSKGFPTSSAVLAALAARAVGKPVKLALTRQQLFSLTSHRTATIQRIQIGAGRDGRITGLDHDALQYCSRPIVYGLQTAVPTRSMYAIPNLSTRHRIVKLDIPAPRWVRAPGEAPGLFALESAIDELAYALEIDPVELRILNEPADDPESGAPFSSRGLVACLRDGAQRFGWSGRNTRPGQQREGRWLIGSGVASACYPSFTIPSTATIRAQRDGTYVVSTAAVDIGTGARTTLTLIAADALKTTPDRIIMEIGRSDYPTAPLAGGSTGTGSWGWAVVKACRALLAQLAERGGAIPDEGLEATADTTEDVVAQMQGPPVTRESFGAQFAQVRVDVDSGEVRVDRMVGVFATGRIVNPRGARSQLLGAMTMGVSMALHEQLEMDARSGDFANHDLASYHVAAHADIHGLEAHWIDEEDHELNPVGTKGAGEIGIVGAAAAIANAVHHATGIRVRDLPITIENLQPGLSAAR
jgi:xanthine dehydrogenase YagR molybdenum-binding subunit